MAILLGPGHQVLDDNGAPVSGAKVRVRIANTTTPADLFSDVGLATPRANPVVANSAGEVPFFFIASGAYDVAFLTSADVELSSAEDVPAWGEDTGDFNRTVSGSGRIKITGSAGAVQIQAGSPSPDNVGGDLTIEGWAGTQLDTLTLDAAATNTSGTLTENSKKLAGVVATAATTFTTATNVDIPLTETPPGVRGFQVDVFDLTHSASPITLGVQFSYDGGGTFKSGASDYAYINNPYYLADGSLGLISRDDAAAHILLNPNGMATKANALPWLTLDILTPESGNTFTACSALLRCWDDGVPDIPQLFQTFGYGVGSYGRATHVRLFVASGGGTLTGKYRVVPQRGFGD